MWIPAIDPCGRQVYCDDFVAESAKRHRQGNLGCRCSGNFWIDPGPTRRASSKHRPHLASRKGCLALLPTVGPTASAFNMERHIPVKHAAIGPIAIHLPQRVETNEQLQAEFPNWDMELIYQKTGIAERHIAAPGECASDLGVQAAQKLFANHQVDPQSIDFLLLCTQSPDYALPTTACMMQERLGLRTSIGALDFNLGCSGYVYGLALAEGLIQSGAAERILLITAETYSKYIAPDDRSLRTIFGDGAAATLIESSDQPSLYGFRFGTDGSGADTLLMTKGGQRPAADAHKPRHRQRWKSDLYMDGPALISFTVEAVPALIEQVLTATSLKDEDIDLYLMHQATRKMMVYLQQRLELEPSRMPLALEWCGNTVSSTLPILIDQLRRDGTLRPAMRLMLVAFGVGWSWAGCIWEETWRGHGS